MIIHFENPDSKPALAFYSRSHILSVKLKELELSLIDAQNILRRFPKTSSRLIIDGKTYERAEVEKNIAILDASYQVSDR